VLVDRGGGVDAGDAGQRAGVVAVSVGGVVTGVSVVSRELAPWLCWAGQAPTWLPYFPSPHELNGLGGVSPFGVIGGLNQVFGRPTVWAIKGPSSRRLRTESPQASR